MPLRADSPSLRRRAARRCQPLGTRGLEVPREVISVIRAISVPVRAGGDIAIRVEGLRGRAAFGACRARNRRVLDCAKQVLEAIGTYSAERACYIRGAIGVVGKGVPVRPDRTLGGDCAAFGVVLVSRESLAIFIRDSSQRERLHRASGVGGLVIVIRTDVFARERNGSQPLVGVIGELVNPSCWISQS